VSFVLPHMMLIPAGVWFTDSPALCCRKTWLAASHASLAAFGERQLPFPCRSPPPFPLDQRRIERL